jgi:hypothetical protein
MEGKNMKQFKKWTDIVAIHNIVKYSKSHPEILQNNPIVQYKSKIKLDGTNAAVGVVGSEVFYQSRERLITPTDDNMGFAAWASKLETFWQEVAQNFGRDLLIYGEWSGPGIQKNVAISKIPKKIFTIFAIRPLEDLDELIVEPSDIKSILFSSLQEDLWVLDWDDCTLTVDFSNTSKLDLEPINKRILEIEQCDPFVKQFFNIEGVGEGLVFYPVSHPGLTNFTNLGWKAKGTEHKTVKQASAAQVLPEKAQNITEFVQLVCTQARLEQGVVKTNSGILEFDKKNLGTFIKWVSDDVLKECKDELAASSLEWKQVCGEISKFARNWFLEQEKKI